MKKLLLLLTFLFALVLPTSLYVSRADELDDVSRQLTEEQKKLADLEARKNVLAKQISSSSASLSSISAELTQAEADLAAITAALGAKEDQLAEWETERNLLVRQHFKITFTTHPLEIILGGQDFLTATANLNYFEQGMEDLFGKITALVGEINAFRETQAQAQKLRDDLAALRAQYQASLASAQRGHSSASNQLAQVKSTINNLTAQQEQLILAKFAATSGTETVGEKPPLSEPLPSPSFLPAFMVSAYGYPHRIGMSQWGAYGRAKPEGGSQDYKTILAVYYKVSTSSIQAYRAGGTIRVNGCSTGPPPWRSDGWSEGTCQSKGYKWYDTSLSMETYIKGLGEMPSDWGRTGGMEALKAQAVAGRSYAWAYANGNGGTICPSTYCQVYLGYNKGSYWEQAVNATPDQVIMSGGAPLKAFYHSTAGGYTISTKAWVSYWTYNDGIKDFTGGQAFEQIAGAPWYHTGWGSRNGTKGEYYPWMKEEEFADIFNAFLLCRSGDPPYTLKSDCSYTQYLSPIDKGGWPMKTVRDELIKLGITPVTSISAVVSTFTSGNEANTASVYVSGAHGTYYFSGRYFRDIFNLRSLGTLQIPTYRYDFSVQR